MIKTGFIDNGYLLLSTDGVGNADPIAFIVVKATDGIFVVGYSKDSAYVLGYEERLSVDYDGTHLLIGGVKGERLRQPTADFILLSSHIKSLYKKKESACCELILQRQY